MNESEIIPLQEALLGSTPGLGRLLELRGWTEPAIRRLGLGLMGDRIMFVYRDVSGAITGFGRYAPDPAKRGDDPKMLAASGRARNLFPPPESLAKDATIWIVEGEPDSVAAHSIGLEATGLPGSSSWDNDWAARFKDRHVIVCCDCDSSGRGASERIAECLAPVAASVRIVDLAPARDDGYDLSDEVTAAEPSDYPQLRTVLCKLADDAPTYVRREERPPRPRLKLSDYRKALHDYIDGEGDTPAWPVPFHELLEITDGGIRPGEVWVVAGWTSNGKSIFVDQFADTVAASGATVHLYLTEMTVVQRGLRQIARRTGIPMKSLRRRSLSNTQREKAKAEVNRLPYAASVVSDWTPAQVVADIRATRTNVAFIDLLHGFHYQDESDLRSIVDEFVKGATTDAGGLDGTAIVLVCQLNDGQMRDARSPKRPKPGLHSLKGSSWIKQRCDTVIFCWLEDDDEGLPTENGEIWIAKQRNGGMDGVDVRLDPLTIAFERRST